MPAMPNALITKGEIHCGNDSALSLRITYLQWYNHIIIRNKYQELLGTEFLKPKSLIQ